MRKFIRKVTRKIKEFIGYTVINIKVQREQSGKLLTKENFFDLYFGMVDSTDFFFVQIGANDGKNNDPIHSYVTKYQLCGIAVEPQPDVFKLLEETYKKYPNVKCAHVAIAKESGVLPFYSVKESYKTDANFSRVTGLATFNKHVLQKTIMRKIPHGARADDYIQETPIPTLSFKDFTATYGIKKIDMIQIDCEGYDYEILKMIDFDHFSPRVINFESVHLSDMDRTECEAMLESRGYKWFRHGIDTCAYKYV